MGYPIAAPGAAEMKASPVYKLKQLGEGLAWAPLYLGPVGILAMPVVLLLVSVTSAPFRLLYGKRTGSASFFIKPTTPVGRQFSPRSRTPVQASLLSRLILGDWMALGIVVGVAYYFGSRRRR
jgi:hypothetical protein